MNLPTPLGMHGNQNKPEMMLYTTGVYAKKRTKNTNCHLQSEEGKIEEITNLILYLRRRNKVPITEEGSYLTKICVRQEVCCL